MVGLSPGQAKRLGRKVDLREDWETVKIDVMRNVLKSKFSLNSELREKLIATGDVELIEGNHGCPLHATSSFRGFLDIQKVQAPVFWIVGQQFMNG